MALYAIAGRRQSGLPGRRDHAEAEKGQQHELGEMRGASFETKSERSVQDSPKGAEATEAKSVGFA